MGSIGAPQKLDVRLSDECVCSGIMTKTELEQYDDVKSVNLKYWVPIMWFSNLLTKARQEGRIYDDMTFKMLMEVCKFWFCMLVKYLRLHHGISSEFESSTRKSNKVV